MRFLSLFAWLLLLTSCQPDGVAYAEVQEQLLRELIQQPEVEKLMGRDGVLRIDDTYYCKDHDCKVLFSSAEVNAEVLSTEDAFMRAMLTLRIYDFSISDDGGFIQYAIGWNGKIRTLDF